MPDIVIILMLGNKRGFTTFWISVSTPSPLSSIISSNHFNMIIMLLCSPDSGSGARPGVSQAPIYPHPHPRKPSSNEKETIEKKDIFPPDLYT
ncbi:hypothetical protein NXS19_000996 [Fusarium pseudograminearum]|nr:hypothetical protein NXS19_000996 [Fusarium pseudograminearum]